MSAGNAEQASVWPIQGARSRRSARGSVAGARRPWCAGVSWVAKHDALLSQSLALDVTAATSARCTAASSIGTPGAALRSGPRSSERRRATRPPRPQSRVRCSAPREGEPSVLFAKGFSQPEHFTDATTPCAPSRADHSAQNRPSGPSVPAALSAGRRAATTSG